MIDYRDEIESGQLFAKTRIDLMTRYYGSYGTGGGTGNQTSSSSGGGTSTSQNTSTPQMTPQQLLSLYGQAVPSILNTTNQGVQNSVSAPALNAANKGAVAGVNAINLNGLSPGEGNAVERSLNQQNQSTGNLGLINPTNTISNAMNFGGAFNSKIPLMNAATNTAAGVAGAGANTMSSVSSLFNPLASNASAQRSQGTSNSVFRNVSNSSGTSANNQTNMGGACFLTTACCEHKGLPDDCEELTILRQFRDDYVPKELVARYYLIAPNLCLRLQGHPLLLDYVYQQIQSCVEDIKNDRKALALRRYTTMVTNLEEVI